MINSINNLTIITKKELTLDENVSKLKSFIDLEGTEIN
jgi:hypothetical protein